MASSSAHRSRPDRRQFLQSLGTLAAGTWLAPTLSGVSAEPSANSAPHTIITANIRLTLAADDTAGVGWAVRREQCAEVIARRRPNVIGLQEVLRDQFADLKKAWPEMSGIGFDGPETDRAKNGYQGVTKNPIFFSRARYDLVAAGGFWLSETPLVAGSQSWDTAHARHATWVRLADRRDGMQFRVINTHLDHRSQPAREKQIALILAEAAQYPDEFPQVLAGDFNADARNPAHAQVVNAGWTDTYTAVHGPAEPGFTFHGFAGPEYPRKKPDNRNGKIDFIFIRGQVRPLAAEIIRDGNDRGFPSDHYFVSAQLALG